MGVVQNFCLTKRTTGLLRKPFRNQHATMKRKKSARELPHKQHFREFESGEEATTMLLSVLESDPTFLLEPERYSSWLRLSRICAWINRFIHNCSSPKEYRTSEILHSNEMKRAEIQLIRLAQRKAFKDEWKALSTGKRLP